MTIIKKFDPVQKTTFPKKYIILVSLGLFILILTQIWANNTMVIYGEKFGKLSSLQQTLNLENQILENEIARQASLISVASKSASLGFLKLDNIQYIR